MKHLFIKRRTSLPILFMYFLLISHLALSQTNSNVKKEDNLGIEPVLMIEHIYRTIVKNNFSLREPSTVCECRR